MHFLYFLYTRLCIPTEYTIRTQPIQNPTPPIRQKQTKKKESPQNPPNTSPPKHKPGQRLPKNPTPKPNILPSAPSQRNNPIPILIPIAIAIPILYKPLQIHPLNLPTTRPGEKHTRTLPTRPVNQKQMEKRRDHDRAGEVEEEACTGLQGKDSGGEAEEEGGYGVEGC